MTTTGVIFTTPEAAEKSRYQALLTAAKRVVPCDAAALLKLEGDELKPVAVDGLSDETLGRKFLVGAHPRLSRLLASPGGMRFAQDCGLPDPYDGLVAGQTGILPVHDCMGAPLRCRGGVWGLLTLDALQPGAFDDIGPSQLEALVALVETGIDGALVISEMQERVRREQALAQAVHSSRATTRELLGNGSAMKRLRSEIDTVAATDLTVLLLGETGVGKELAAQRLHAHSARHAMPLIQINCAALPESLADSELFGHKKGAFTDAVQDRTGKFELADGGTLFLDEVGELPLTVQAKLLRVLQSGEIQRPGSDRTLKVDVRVMAATNRDLPAAIAQGRFRADLYHRLSVYPLVVPPLRERGRDVIALAGGFLEENQHRLGARNMRLSPASKAVLLAHGWPGNVRELEHVISRASLRAFTEHGRTARWIAIEPSHLALDASAAVVGQARNQGVPAIAPIRIPMPETSTSLREATDAFQRAWLAACLTRHHGHLANAAREAGMDRSNFHRLLRRFGLLPYVPESG